MNKPGPKNLITDVQGLKVGNAHDGKLRSGVTVLLPDEPAVAAIDIRGGGPGTREASTIGPTSTVDHIHGLVLSGGSAFGLDAATGVQNYLKQKNIGFEIGPVKIPIVPQAIIFDMLNGGDKDWGTIPPYQDLAFEACENTTEQFDLGTIGAGYGATTYDLKGGLGSASLITDDGFQIGALVAVNAAGKTTIGDTKHFWASSFEIGNEFGGHGRPTNITPEQQIPHLKGSPGQNTTIAIIATNATLTPSQASRFAIMAQTGMAQAIYPCHTPLDGDVVFALSTAKKELKDPIYDLATLGTYAANTLARAIARGVYKASTYSELPKGVPTYKENFNH